MQHAAGRIFFGYGKGKGETELRTINKRFIALHTMKHEHKCNLDLNESD
jgi:hypothetical protein